MKMALLLIEVQSKGGTNITWKGGVKRGDLTSGPIIVAGNRTPCEMPISEPWKHGILQVWHCFCNRMPSEGPK